MGDVNDLFFIVPKKKAKKVMEKAISLANSVKADELDCAISLARQPTNKWPLEVLQMGLKNDNTLWTFIIRKNSEYYPPYTDIGCRTGRDPEYFLWIDMDIDEAMKIVKKYKLKQL